MINQNTLKRLLFPLGRYTKDQIRDKANQLGLLNANRPDSQEICFVSQKSYRTFVEDRLTAEDIRPGQLNILMAPYWENIKEFITIPLANVKA